MKKYILLLTIILTSCSTLKIEEQIVHDLIKGKILNSHIKNLPKYLIEDANSSQIIINYYEMALADKNLDNYKRRIDFRPQNFSNWPIDNEEINKIRKIQEKENLSYKWEALKFKNLDIPVISENELFSKIDNNILPTNTIGLIISKPILSLNKKYALIEYSNIYYVGGTKTTFFLMEKIDGKWAVKLEIFNTNE